MDFVPVAVFAALVKKGVDFIKFVTAGDVNAIVTQLVTWIIGVGLAFLFAHSDFGTTFDVAGTTLSTLNPWSLVLVGLAVGSGASLAWDTLKSFDGTQSAATPSLVKPTPKAE